MFEIKNKIIKITKGDSAAINVNLMYSNGNEYTMQTGDKLTLTVRKKPNSGVLVQVESTTNKIELTPTQTKNLEVGQCCFDIQLETANHDIFTVVGLQDNQVSNMVVWDEVTV